MDRTEVLLAVLSLSLSVGCPAKETSRTEPATKAAPEQKPVKPTEEPAGADLKRLSVSPTQSSAWRLPPAAFSFTYPAKADLSLAKAGRRNPYYALVELYRGKKISESVSISHVDLKGGPVAKWDLLGPVVMKRLQTAMQRQLAGMKIVSSGKASFGGKDVYQFRSEFEITDTRMGDPGKYRAVWVALVPDSSSSSPNGASLTMTVRQDSGSEVSSWDDFTSKGIMGRIWRSFEFADARHPPEKIGHYADGTVAKKGDRWGLPTGRGFPLARIRPDTVRLTRAQFNVVSSKRLRFTFGRGSGRDGFDTLVVDEKGDAEYLFQERDWKLSRYKIRLSDLALLRKFLSSMGYASMPRAYHANVHDGDQWFVKIETGKHKKGVYCDNFFPQRIRRLDKHVRVRLIDRYTSAIKRGARRVPSFHREWKRLVGSESYPD